MSQQKNLTNFDKGKLLLFSRDRIALSRDQMADQLSIAPPYLAQLENAQRTVDEWFVERAMELERSFAVQEGN